MNCYEHLGLDERRIIPRLPPLFLLIREVTIFAI
jgi:hypothetical protein